MAFTLSHVAAVLPGIRPLERLFPAAAPVLVAASMVPDLPHYLPLPVTREQTHSWAGIVGSDPLIAVLAGAVWILVLARPLRDLAPRAVRERMAAVGDRPLRVCDVPVLYLAGVAGALTHVVWDGFTHSDGWFVRGAGPLAGFLFGRHVYQWLQFGTSAAGLAVLAVLAVRWYHRAEPRIVPDHGRWRHAVWLATAAAAAAGAVLGALEQAPWAIYASLSAMLTGALTWSGLVVGVSCILWWLVRPGRRDRRRPWNAAGPADEARPAGRAP